MSLRIVNVIVNLRPRQSADFFVHKKCVREYVKGSCQNKALEETVSSHGI